MSTSQCWTQEQVNALFNKPFLELLFEAQQVHRQHFTPSEVQVSTLLSIKTGACPEDCKYCPQSARYSTGLEIESLMQVQQVLDAARKARDAGSTRFCMGAAWKNPRDRDMPFLEQMVRGVKTMGLETCMTLGMLSDRQAQRLAEAGLDFYNHNLDTSPEFYGNIATTRSYQDRLDTLSKVRQVGIKVCSGGIVGLGEDIQDRAGLLMQLANLPTPPESVPINMLVKVKGTPLAHNDDVDPFEFIRTIAVARIMMPSSYVRLSAGRTQMNEQTQALCFMAGANSVFYGCKLLTTPNPEKDYDMALFRKLGINIECLTTAKGNKIQKEPLTESPLSADVAHHDKYNMLMTNRYMARINSALTYRRREHAYRERQALSSGNDRLIRDGDKQYLNFSSNDYLGLARHPEVIAAWQHGAAQAGVGAGGSGHVIGYSLYHQRLEQYLADWLGFPRALLFTSGFAANQALIETLTTSGDHILVDRLSHASLLVASMHSPATLRRFAHNDTDALQRLLRRDCTGNRLVITEGVFSMSGDKAPLSDLAEITRTAGGWLMVDDAHGIGVIGEEGRGCAWASANRPDLLVVTFSKAVGVSGAAVLCTAPVAEYLLQFSRYLIYSTAAAPAQIAATEVALNIVRRDDTLRQLLWDNITRFRRGVAALGLVLMPSDTAIQPLIIGDNLRALQLVQRLRERGVWLTAIRPPAVPPGSARLRITLTASHLADDIDTLLEALSDVQQQHNA